MYDGKWEDWGVNHDAQHYICCVEYVCSEGSHQVTTSTGFMCYTPTPCDYTSEYSAFDVTISLDSICLPLTECLDTQYEATAPTSTSDRICADITACDGITTYEHAPATATSDRVCAPLTGSGIFPAHFFSSFRASQGEARAWCKVCTIVLLVLHVYCPRFESLRTAALVVAVPPKSCSPSHGR
jgi:hypothetical protein